MKVITEHSAYEVDSEGRTLKRHPIHVDAADHEDDGKELDLIRTLRCDVGESAVFLVKDPEPAGKVYLKVTTPVTELIP